MTRIYLDNNATTPMLPEVAEAMAPFSDSIFGNASSAHQEGRRARRALEDAREKMASLLGALPEEIIFTSGATEANNLALFGLVGEPPSHLLTSPIEHPCVVEPMKHFAEHGHEVTWLPVGSDGVVILDAIPESARLTAIMLANHETGTIQPIAKWTQSLPPESHFHCDAVQAVGRIPVRFHDLGVTSLSLSAHKMHGPKGVGALLLRKGVKLTPRLLGGHQQQGHRPGTEPVSLIVGMARALELAHEQMEERSQHVMTLRSHFLDILQSQELPIEINGSADSSLPHTLNLSFPGLRSDALLMNLDLAGIACSTGSACSSGSLLPSPVLQAMNVSSENLESAMRFSFSALQSIEEIEEAAHRILKVVSRLRDVAED